MSRYTVDGTEWRVQNKGQGANQVTRVDSLTNETVEIMRTVTSPGDAARFAANAAYWQGRHDAALLHLDQAKTMLQEAASKRPRESDAEEDADIAQAPEAATPPDEPLV